MNVIISLNLVMAMVQYLVGYCRLPTFFGQRSEILLHLYGI